MPKIARELPFAEITLRKYEKPATDDIRDLTKKLCQSLGLLMPGDYRDSIVDIFLSIIQAPRPLTAKELEKSVLELRKSYKLENFGTAPSNIRRQVRRLKNLYLVEHWNGRYRLTENLTLPEIWVEKIKPIIIESTTKRIQNYMNEITNSVKKER